MTGWKVYKGGSRQSRSSRWHGAKGLEEWLNELEKKHEIVDLKSVYATKGFLVMAKLEKRGTNE